jgi:hypothetical protein
MKLPSKISPLENAKFLSICTFVCTPMMVAVCTHYQSEEAQQLEEDELDAMLAAVDEI